MILKVVCFDKAKRHKIIMTAENEKNRAPMTHKHTERIVFTLEISDQFRVNIYCDRRDTKNFAIRK